MKMNRLALACGAAMLGLSSLASAEVSMNIGVTSNYIWRGMTQNDNSTAFSGGLDWSHESGFYAGTWISEAGADYELDLYGGYNGSIGDFGYGAGVTYYTYPSDDDANFAELGLSGSWQMLSFGLDYTFASDIDTDEGDYFTDGDMHYYVGASFDLPQDFSLGLTVGRYAWDEEGKTYYVDATTTDKVEDFTYYQVDLSKSVGEFGDVTLSLSDSDIDNSSDVGGENGDLRFFVSWAKTF